MLGALVSKALCEAQPEARINNRAVATQAKLRLRAAYKRFMDSPAFSW
jgi:hypothetical protein